MTGQEPEIRVEETGNKDATTYSVYNSYEECAYEGILGTMGIRARD